MTFPQADRLFELVMECMRQAGGIYAAPSVRTQENVLVALAHRHFAIRIRGGAVRWFACYKRIHPEDMQEAMARNMPADIITGPIMYVSEAVNLDGPAGMAAMIKQLRKQATGMQGLFWHRPKKNDKVLWFPSQKGKEA